MLSHAGNLTADQNGQQYVYDAWNRLVTVKDNGSTTIASYEFDVLGRRIVETVSSTTRDIYFSAGWQVLEERVGSAVKTQYVWSPVYIDALVERDRDADNSSGNGLEERLYVQQDANFNVTALIDTSGTVVERVIYDPFGKPEFLNASWSAISGSAYSFNILHQGGRYEVIVSLYHSRGRELHPTLGRFLQVDPIQFGAGDTNCYRVVGNSPTNGLDPSGLSEGSVWYDWIPFAPIFTGIACLSWREQQRERAERLEAQREEMINRGVLGRVPLIEQRTRAREDGGSSVLSGLRDADSTFATRQENAFGRAGMIASVGITWAGSQGVFVNGSRFTFNFRAGQWHNASNGSRATAAEAAAANAAAHSGGPGTWIAESTAGWSARARAYQAQIAGRPTGNAYSVNGVRFDGYNAGALLEAKGPGYAWAVQNGRFIQNFNGARGMLEQARNQVTVAGGRPIIWNVAEEEAAQAITHLFANNGITGIQVVHVPLAP